MRHVGAILLLTLWFSASSQLRFYTYPQLKLSNDTIKKFGQAIPDPFKGLENLKSPETKKWIADQNKLLDNYRRSVFAKYTVCERRLGDNAPYYEYFYPEDTNNYFALRYRYEATPTIMYKTHIKHAFDVFHTTYRFQHSENDRIGVEDIKLSEDKKHVAVLLSHSGSDWNETRIFDIKTQKVLPDSAIWSKFNTIWWKHDGFFYAGFDSVYEGKYGMQGTKQCVKYHKIGTAASADKCLNLGISNKDIEDLGITEVDSQYLVFNYTKTEGSKKLMVLARFNTDSMDKGVHEFLVVPYNQSYTFDIIGHIGSRFVIKSTHKAPNGKIVIYDSDKVNTGQLLIDQYAQPIRQATMLKDRIFCVYYDKGKFMPFVFDTAGKFLKQIKIPDGFSISGFTYCYNDSMTVYRLHSFQSEPGYIAYDFKNLISLVDEDDVKHLFTTNFTSKIVYCKSQDSTEIPIYLTWNHKIGPPDTSRPALMYAYGGFGVSTDPFFDDGFELFMNRGGILAVPLIRGGGELGEAWHTAGSKLNKQKSFDDFIAATEYLINNGLANRHKIVIHGISNGGLLVGAVAAQRPDLYQVVVPSSAVLDLVNLLDITLAESCLQEYGDPSDSIEYVNLCRLSPVHNIKRDVQYPATMLIASDHDDRVFPIHTYKYLAALQHFSKEKIQPYLLYLEDYKGHSAETFHQKALMYAFIFENIGIDMTAW